MNAGKLLTRLICSSAMLPELSITNSRSTLAQPSSMLSPLSAVPPSSSLGLSNLIAVSLPSFDSLSLSPSRVVEMDESDSMPSPAPSSRPSCGLQPSTTQPMNTDEKRTSNRDMDRPLQ